MNRKNQRKLYRRYLDKIDIAIINNDIENEVRLNILIELKIIIEIIGVKSFYGLYNTYQLPHLDKKGKGSVRIEHLQNDMILNREVTLRKLGI